MALQLQTLLAPHHTEGEAGRAWCPQPCSSQWESSERRGTELGAMRDRAQNSEDRAQNSEGHRSELGATRDRAQNNEGQVRSLRNCECSAQQKRL